MFGISVASVYSEFPWPGMNPLSHITDIFPYISACFSSNMAFWMDIQLDQLDHVTEGVDDI
jgi:hypothetical protein